MGTVLLRHDLGFFMVYYETLYIELLPNPCCGLFAIKLENMLINQAETELT